MKIYCKKIVKKNQNVPKLATVILAKISDILLERIRSETKNKQSEAYPIVLCDPLVKREEGIKNKYNNKAGKKTAKEKTRIKNITRTLLSHAKNISRTCQTQLTDEQTTLLSHGLTFIPVAIARENLIKHKLLTDFNEFARRMHLQCIFYGEEKEPHPCHVKSLKSTSSQFCGIRNLLRRSQI